jgi:hypothetical protein
VRVHFGTLDGRFGRAQRIARARGLRGAQLDVNARGDAVLVWWVDDGVARDRVYVSLRRRGGRFGAPRPLATGRIRGTSAAIGAGGDVLVAWDALGVVRTRFKARSDRDFRAMDELRSQDAYSTALQTAVAPGGGAWVAWTAQLLTEGGGSEDAFIEVATRPPAAHRFRPARLLQQAPDWARPGPVSLAVGAQGDAVLAWAMWDGGPAGQPAFTEIRSAGVTGAGTPTVTTLSRFASVELRDGAVAATGGGRDATILWTQSTQLLTDDNRLYASTRTASSDWGAPELVFEGLGASGSAGYPPGATSPLVVFSSRLAEPPLRRVVQATVRR